MPTTPGAGLARAASIASQPATVPALERAASMKEQHRDRTVGEKHLTVRIPETLAKVVTPIGRKGGQIACPA
jgi:hypothetical protein